MLRALAIASLLGCGCESTAGGKDDPVGFVTDEPVDAAVVAMVARREGIAEAEAHARVADTLRAVAAARSEAAQQAEPGALVDDPRREHLQRTARARVWLDESFEPSHRPEDIPEDDPAVQQAKSQAKFVHPRLHILCQLVATPSGATTLEEITAAAEDPAWRAKAKARFDPAAQRLRRYVHVDDPSPCTLMQKLSRFETADADGVSLHVEAKAFDLDACAETADDGTCTEPRFAPEWVEQVRKAAQPGFLPPFSTRFGWHLAYVAEIVPAHSLDDPETLSWLRTQVHPQWQRDAFARYVDRLREGKAVRVASTAEPAP